MISNDKDTDINNLRIKVIRENKKHSLYCDLCTLNNYNYSKIIEISYLDNYNGIDESINFCKKHFIIFIKDCQKALQDFFSEVKNITDFIDKK